MRTFTFDTLDATRRLRDAGFDECQAEAVIRVLGAAHDSLVTREYLDHQLTCLDKGLTIKLGSMTAVAVALMATLAKML